MNKCPRCNSKNCAICIECDEPMCGFCDCEEDILMNTYTLTLSDDGDYEIVTAELDKCSTVSHNKSELERGEQ